ncbi:NUDIX hydrolase [Solicola gregarius]|uniref:NUDIX hydrolase n=1 Tax=Solicola gregarius TaxID=2908642 RepID=UPI00230574EB|nr:NUDIX hydrolase [Solicola gregarius]
MTDPAKPTLEAEGGVVLRRRTPSGDDPLIGYVVEQDGEPVGAVEVRQAGDRRGELAWTTYPAYRGRGVATAAVRRLIAYAFDDLGLARVEARVAPDNRAALRVAARSGLRLEGRLRAHEAAAGERLDLILLARLAHDPDVRERDGFIGILNSSLPRKRVIAQGLLHDERGRVLLCELTYKREWDLPGGVVEPDESPADALVRELREELDIEVRIRGLRTVNWLPAWAGWDDACVFVFDLGVADSSLTQAMHLQRTEIAGVHWCDDDIVRDRATAVTIELLDALAAGAPAYREHGR